MYYYEHPYERKVDVSVLEREGSRVLLDRTILYEGGGGQPADRGFAVCNGRKVPIIHLGDNWHRMDGDCGDEFTIELDWEFRYGMMKAHTAEHTFFRFLQNIGAELVKISLGEVSTIVFRGDISEEDILRAEDETRRLIKEGREVRWFWIGKDDSENYPELRIKRERIKGDTIRVVEIENHDLSACRGIHVKNLREIGDFAVLKYRKGKNKEVKFVVADRARESHYLFSRSIRRISWELNVEMEKFPSFVYNLIQENERMRFALRSASEVVPFTEMQCGGIKVLYLVLDGADRKAIVRRMMEKANEGYIVIFGDGISKTVSLACPDGVDCKTVFQELLKKHGGRGGGKGNFMSGGVEDVNAFIEELKSILCGKDFHLHGDENDP